MKITKATFKKLIRDNKDKLFLNVENSFDSMSDCMSSVHGEFTPVVYIDKQSEYDLDIRGLCLVSQSRDYFSEYSDDKYQGIRYSNCCGSGVLAIKKQI